MLKGTKRQLIIIAGLNKIEKTNYWHCDGDLKDHYAYKSADEVTSQTIGG